MSLADLRVLVAQAEHADDETTVAEVAALVGVGVRALQSRERTADLARRRAVVAWVLHQRLGWTQARTARVLGRTVRAVQMMVIKP
jgi:hypothetical protein